MKDAGKARACETCGAPTRDARRWCSLKCIPPASPVVRAFAGRLSKSLSAGRSLQRGRRSR